MTSMHTSAKQHAATPPPAKAPEPVAAKPVAQPAAAPAPAPVAAVPPAVQATVAAYAREQNAFNAAHGAELGVLRTSVQAITNKLTELHDLHSLPGDASAAVEQLLLETRDMSTRVDALISKTPPIPPVI